MSEEDVRNRCKYVDIPFEAHFCMFYIETPPESAPTARLLADVSPAVVPARAAIVRSGIVILCFNCESPRCSLHCSKGTCPMDKASISWKLENLMERYGLFCGRGSKFTQLTDAEVAFRQAKAACAFGKRAHEKNVATPLIHDWERVVSFDKFAIDSLVEQSRGGDRLVRATFAGRVIDAMTKRDEETGSDDFKFLFEYLIGEREAVARRRADAHAPQQRQVPHRPHRGTLRHRHERPDAASRAAPFLLPARGGRCARRRGLTARPLCARGNAPAFLRASSPRQTGMFLAIFATDRQGSGRFWPMPVRSVAYMANALPVCRTHGTRGRGYRFISTREDTPAVPLRAPAPTRIRCVQKI